MKIKKNCTIFAFIFIFLLDRAYFLLLFLFLFIPLDSTFLKISRKTFNKKELA